MKTFIFEVATDDKWEKKHRVFTVEAKNLDEAFKLSKEQIKEDELLYQVSVKKDGSSFHQPVWDFFNGSLEK